jgi:hypothetical protein
VSKGYRIAACTLLLVAFGLALTPVASAKFKGGRGGGKGFHLNLKGVPQQCTGYSTLNPAAKHCMDDWKQSRMHSGS